MADPLVSTDWLARRPGDGSMWGRSVSGSAMALISKKMAPGT